MHRQLIMVITSFLIFSTVQAVEFTEGYHYLEIKGEITEKKEITEFFSFYCPACFRQEAFMNELKASLPKGAVLIKIMSTVCREEKLI